MVIFHSYVSLPEDISTGNYGFYHKIWGSPIELVNTRGWIATRSVGLPRRLGLQAVQGWRQLHPAGPQEISSDGKCSPLCSPPYHIFLNREREITHTHTIYICIYILIKKYICIVIFGNNEDIHCINNHIYICGILTGCKNDFWKQHPHDEHVKPLFFDKNSDCSLGHPWHPGEI